VTDPSARPVVVVTGASRGLGAATARLLSRAGADVVLAARSRADLEATASEVRDAGGRAIVEPADLADETAARRLVDRTLATFGRLDGLVNNAGVVEPIERLDVVEPAEFRRAFEVNVYPLLYTVQAALPALRAVRGRIVNVSSGAALNPTAGWGAYCSSKAAALMLTRILALEEPEVVTVAFRPGVVDTAMQAAIRRAGHAGMTPDEHDRYVALKREGRLLSPEEPARGLAWLALHAPTELSGQLLRYDDERVRAGAGALFG